jgi:hypothetical protein
LRLDTAIEKIRVSWNHTSNKSNPVLFHELATSSLFRPVLGTAHVAI